MRLPSFPAASLLLLAIAGPIQHALSKAVFAHFMLEYVDSWDVGKWESEIALAQAAHIDAFALNMRQDDDTAASSAQKAFKAAENKGFKLLFSFDYAGGGPWPAPIVKAYLNVYRSSSAYFKHNGKPFASTFEGPDSASDWKAIKDETNAFFVPDWSSLGAKAALEIEPGVPDGLFSWAGWPWGNTDMDTYVDASYQQYLNGLPYMMPVSPWFYTNLPGYNKNWVWRGDDLWYDRWQEVLFVQPEWVQILTWNDYGESHYIGPLHDEEMELFDEDHGRAAFNYAENMPHDAWRQHILPFMIDQYKTNQSTVTQEAIVAWYRLTPGAACNDGRTSGNTHSQLQVEFAPTKVSQDKIFFSALLSSNKAVTVTVGGVNLAADWSSKPAGGVGVYHGSVSYGSNLGAVVVTVGDMVFSGEPITTNCNRVKGQSGLTNWNAWVGSKAGSTVNAKAPSISNYVCIRGKGVGNFAGLCDFSCHYGYCPIGACTCTAIGPQVTRPGPETPGYGVIGYPAEGLSASYSGLCSFVCNYGWCPAGVCGTTQHTPVVPKVSEFLPSACTSGTGAGDLEGLCSYSCNYGFCPMHSCTCTGQGALNLPPATKGLSGRGDPDNDKDPFIYDDLCDFACSRGYCPPGPCVYKGSQDAGDGIVYGDPEMWEDPEPVAKCIPPCTFIPPPWQIPDGGSTVIEIPPVTTSLEVGCSTGMTTYTRNNVVTSEVLLTIITQTTIIAVPRITTTEINWWNIDIPLGVENSVITLTSSVLPPVITITNDANRFPGVACPTVTRTIHLPPWPYVTPSGGSTHKSDDPPVTIKYTSSTSSSKKTSTTDSPDHGSCGNCKKGHRCTGLFCNMPGFPPFPDVDFMDPKNPDNPYGHGKPPYEPEPEKCTTQTYSTCTTGCIAGGSCTSTCATAYKCSGTDSSTIGTQTLAGVATAIEEAWNRETHGAAWTSSLYQGIRSDLQMLYGTSTTTTTTTTTKTTTTTTARPAPSGTADAYSVYFWECSGGGLSSMLYYVGKTGDGECGSVNGLAEGGPANAGGMKYSICGSSRSMTSGDDFSTYFTSTGGQCVAPSSGKGPVSCKNNSGQKCTVTRTLTCHDVCKG